MAAVGCDERQPGTLRANHAHGEHELSLADTNLDTACVDLGKLSDTPWGLQGRSKRFPDR